MLLYLNGQPTLDSQETCGQSMNDIHQPCISCTEHHGALLDRYILGRDDLPEPNKSTRLNIGSCLPATKLKPR